MHRLRVKIETSGLVSIDSDVQYSFRAGEEIILTHGFSTEEGSEFVAEIVSVIDCGQPDEEISDYGVAFDEIQYLTAQKAKQLSEFEVYPNPVSDILQVSFNAEKHEFLKIEIQDYTGRKVKDLGDYLISNNYLNLKFYLSDLQRGVYYLVIYEKNKVILVYKILKK